MTESGIQVSVQTLMDHLSELGPGAVVPLGDKADSYRGYYEHVAIEPGVSLASTVLAMLADKLGTPMTGWKGGDYTFSPDSLVFSAYRGDLGDAVVLRDGHIDFTDEYSVFL